MIIIIIGGIKFITTYFVNIFDTRIIFSMILIIIIIGETATTITLASNDIICIIRGAMIIISTVLLQSPSPSCQQPPFLKYAPFPETNCQFPTPQETTGVTGGKSQQLTDSLADGSQEAGSRIGGAGGNGRGDGSGMQSSGSVRPRSGTWSVANSRRVKIKAEKEEEGMALMLLSLV